VNDTQRELAYRRLGFVLPSGRDPWSVWQQLQDAGVQWVGALAADGWAGLTFIADDIDIFAFRIVVADPAKAGHWLSDEARLLEQLAAANRAAMKQWQKVGPHAPDESFASMRWLGWEGGPAVDWQWSVLGRGEAVGRLRLDSPATVFVQAYCPWPDPARHLVVYDGDEAPATLRGRCLEPGTRDASRFIVAADRAGRIVGAGQMSAIAVFDDCRQLRLFAAQGPEHDPLCQRSLSWQREPARIDQTLHDAAQRFAERRTTTTGLLDQAADAINDQLQWSVVYTPSRGRRYVTVSRSWAQANNSPPDFLWDSFFNALLIAQDDAGKAREMVRDVLSWQAQSGMLPQYGQWFDIHGILGDPVAYGHSQYPIGSLVVAKLHLRHPDLEFLREAYPKLLRFNRWWFADRGDGQAWRDGNGNGLLELGCNYPAEIPAKFLRDRACFESHDDSPQWHDGVPYNPVTQTLELDTVERNCTYACDCWVLAWLADLLGEASDARALRAEHQRIAARINEMLWCPRRSVYLNRPWHSGSEDPFRPQVAPDVFLSLLGRVAPPERAQALRRLFHDPSHFAGPFILPTISRNDPTYPQQHYWRGKIWAPINWLVYQAFDLADWQEEAAALAHSSVSLFMEAWRREGRCYENFLATTGQGASDPHYTWGALLPLIGIEELIDVTPWHGLRMGTACPASPEPRGVHGYHVAGHAYDVELSGEGLAVRRDGQAWLRTDAPAQVRQVTFDAGGARAWVRSARAARLWAGAVRSPQPIGPVGRWVDLGSI
jgi:hypothetical protein